MENLIVGLVGPLGSGKTTIANYLIKKGFYHLRFSAPIEQEAKRRDLPITRKILQDIGDEFREKGGSDHISKLLIKDMLGITDHDKFVVDGFRNPAEVGPFKELENFVLIGVTTDPKIRFDRLVKRGQEHDPRVWDDFQNQERRDQGIGQPEHGQQVLSSLELADFVIDTDKVKSEVFSKIDKILEEFKDVKRKNSDRPKECSFC